MTYLNALLPFIFSSRFSGEGSAQGFYISHISPLVRVFLLSQHYARALSVSMAGTESMISLLGWLAFFDSKLCSMRCGNEFGLEFN